MKLVYSTGGQIFLLAQAGVKKGGRKEFAGVVAAYQIGGGGGGGGGGADLTTGAG